MRARAIRAAAVLATAAFACPAKAAGDCAPKDWAALQGWQGVWIAEGLQTGISGRDATNEPNIGKMKLIGWNAPFNDNGWRRFEAAIGPGPNGTAKNKGWGFPVMMSSPSPFTFTISPWETTIVSQYREIRHVYTDGRGHPAEDDRWPNEWGDSIGCWDGDTLVIDTTDVKWSPGYNLFNAPVSDRARFVERLRLVAPGRIESDFTVTDPETMTEPWRVTVAYVLEAATDRLVHDGDTLDNDRTLVAGSTMDIAPPSAPAATLPPERPEVLLSDTELDRVVGTYKLDGPPFTMTVQRQGHRLLFRVDPVQPFLIPLHPEGPLSFFVNVGTGTGLRFTADDAGKVGAFAGTAPDGNPVSGKRLD